jgi:outer membrane protein OmpA-like peptidoglycan-associated protein
VLLSARLAMAPVAAHAEEARSRLYLPPPTATEPASTGAETSTEQRAKRPPAVAPVPNRTGPPVRAAVGSTEARPATLPTPPPAYIPPDATTGGETGGVAAEAPSQAGSTPRPGPNAASPTAAVGRLQSTASPAGLPGKADVRVVFSAGGDDLDDPARRDLDALVNRLGFDGRHRVQVLAYARGDDERPSAARRLSLSRASAVRTYLVDRGIGPRRIDVRALGDGAPEEPRDRVDVVVTPP